MTELIRGNFYFFGENFLSPNYPCKVLLTIGKNIYALNSAYQALTFLKAMYFGDYVTASYIANSAPADLEDLDNAIQGVNPEVWDNIRTIFIVIVNISKFALNKDLKKLLYNTGNLYLVYCTNQPDVFSSGFPLSTIEPYPNMNVPTYDTIKNGPNIWGNALSQTRSILKANRV